MYRNCSISSIHICTLDIAKAVTVNRVCIIPFDVILCLTLLARLLGFHSTIRTQKCMIFPRIKNGLCSGLERHMRHRHGYSAGWLELTICQSSANEHKDTYPVLPFSIYLILSDIDDRGHLTIRQDAQTIHQTFLDSKYRLEQIALSGSTDTFRLDCSARQLPTRRKMH